MKAVEANFDGLVGPTHNYSGLSYGNVASKNNELSVARPKQAALQGLEKMKSLHDRGFLQGIIPPQERPNIQLLRSWGFKGNTDAQVIEHAWKESPVSLAMATSAASMWTANAATISPSADTEDGRVHFTPANLAANAHRAQEADQTYRILKSIFTNEKYFMVHPPVEGGFAFGDEGAANHTRLCNEYGEKGVEVFCYGKVAFNPTIRAPQKYPARQTLESYQAMARNHGLDPALTLFVQQNPDTIDQGVFHNDVISVGNRNVFFHHEKAFLDDGPFWNKLRELMPSLVQVTVKDSIVPVSEAVKTYLFNTQLLQSPQGHMILVAPIECQESNIVRPYIESMVADSSNPINEVLYFDLRQSMKNGGGPACLRLRVVLNKEEQKHLNQSCLLTNTNYPLLVNWVEKHYREELTHKDLRDPQLLIECRTALDELTKILNLGAIYPFQR